MPNEMWIAYWLWDDNDSWMKLDKVTRKILNQSRTKSRYTLKEMQHGPQNAVTH